MKIVVAEKISPSAIALLQDFALLKMVIRAWIGVYLEKVDSGRIDPAAVDRLLCHYSARSLRRRGLLISFGEASGDPDPVPPRRLGSAARLRESAL